jgi:hypothetical protein
MKRKLRGLKPREIQLDLILEELPKSFVGKVLRRLLVE